MESNINTDDRQKTPSGGSNDNTNALQAEEDRLRDKLRAKQQRESQVGGSLRTSTGNPVDSTGGASRDAHSTPTTKNQPFSSHLPSSSVSDEAAERGPLLSTTTHSHHSDTTTKVIQAATASSAKAPETSQSLESPSESRSRGSGLLSLTRESDQSQTSNGRQRKRQRRNMNRDAHRRGEAMPFDNRSGSANRNPPGGRGPPHKGGATPLYGREDRSEGHSLASNNSRGDRRPSSLDRRGPPPPHQHQQQQHRGEYDYSGYRRSRSRSPRGGGGGQRRGGLSPPSRSGSRSSRSRSSKSLSRSHSRSPRRSRSDHGSRDGRGRKRLRNSPGRRSGSGRRGDGSRGSRGSRVSGSGSRRRSGSRHSPSPSSSSSSSSSSGEEPTERVLGTKEDESTFSKDQRTVFVSQLVMRATEKDIRRYFRKKVGCQVREVILLRDKRTGNHKGCAYVQLGRIEDVNKAVGVAGQPPDFQRFPILVKPSEAEKNYVIQASSSVVTASMMGTSTAASKPLLSAQGKMIEAQKAYVGGLDPSVTEEHIFALFSQFGQLEKVTMQMDPATKTSRGYAFLSYRDPKEANLAIQTMSNQVLAGRPIKTGWASQTSTVQGTEIVTSDEFPEDATHRATKALSVLAQMSGVTDASVANANISETAERALDAAMAGALATKPTASAVPTVAQARATLSEEQWLTTTCDQPLPDLGTAPVEAAKLIGGNEIPTQHILVHNMFDKDTESGENWPAEIKEEFEEECSKFGTIVSVTVLSDEPGGQIYASFDSVDAAVKCAQNLAGRWFDKRQLRVDYMEEPHIPISE